jgi:hypothetical protein
MVVAFSSGLKKELASGGNLQKRKINKFVNPMLRKWWW